MDLEQVEIKLSGVIEAIKVIEERIKKSQGFMNKLQEDFQKDSLELLKLRSQADAYKEVLK